jgi:hypothetical protein
MKTNQKLEGKYEHVSLSKQVMGFQPLAVDRLLWKYGKVRVRAPPEGECLYHSVAYQV